MWAGGFIVISTGRKRRNRASRSRFGWFEYFQGLWDIGVYLALA